MSAPKRKGSAHERALANRLWSLGLAVLRGCSSGGGARRRFVPDIVAVYGGRVAVMEVKYRSKPETIRISRERVARLIEFARRCGGEAYIAVKFGGSEWRFVQLINEADVVIRPDEVLSGLTVEQLASKLKSRCIAEFSNGTIGGAEDHKV